MKFYIAGPMRGYDGFNFPAFFAAEKALFDSPVDRRKHVFNPARNDVNCRSMERWLDEDPTGLSAGRWLVENWDESTDLRSALAEDLDWICRFATHVMVLPGWEASRGAQAEVATALALGIHVFEYDPEPEPTRLPAPEEIVQAYADAAKRASDAHIFLNELDGRGGQMRVEEKPLPGSLAERLGMSLPVEDLGGLFEPKPDGEVRTTSASGGQKGVKPQQFDQIPPKVLMLLAEHFGKGAAKYAAHNFRRGYEWSKNYNALLRHLMAFWDGEDYDNHMPTCPEGCPDHTESHHLAAVIWHAVVLLNFYEEHPEYDDRYKGHLQ